MSGFTRGFLLVLAISTLGTIGGGAVTPVLPVFVQDALGGADTLVGVVVAISPLCALVGGLLAGPRIDRHGRRIVAVGGLAIALVGALLMVPAETVGLTVAARTIYGFGMGATAAALITWAVAEVPFERRGRALSIYGMTVWVGLSVGPQLGQAVANATSFRGVWLLGVGVVVAALLLALSGHEPPRTVTADTSVDRKLVPLGAIRPGILIAVAAYGEGVITALLVLHLVDRGVHAGAGFGGAASVFTIFAASVIVFRILAAPLFDRLRPERIATGGFALEASGLAILAIASSFGAAALGATLMGAGFAVLFPALALVATEASGEQHQGAALGAFGAAFGLGLFVGSLLGGVISSLVGTSAAHFSAAVLCAGATVYLLGRHEQLGSTRPALRDPLGDQPT